MNVSEVFIRRPVATSLLALAILLAGVAGYLSLPVAPLPKVDMPTIQVQAALPGASPETMASTVATPLERRFGRIAGVAEITSTSSLGQTQIAIQLDLERDIDAAARDVQAAINILSSYARALRGRLEEGVPAPALLGIVEGELLQRGFGGEAPIVRRGRLSGPCRWAGQRRSMP